MNAMSEAPAPGRTGDNGGRSASDREALAEALGAIARLAGGVIIEVARKGLQEREKPDGSLCTAADIAAEELIVDALARDFPDVPVIAEESAAGFEGELASRFFLVDPIDGTSDFVAGTGSYTVNIALVENGRPVAGTIYAPRAKRLWVGGESARVIDCEADASPLAGNWTTLRTRRAPADGLVAVASLRHGDAVTERFLAGLPIRARSGASSSLKFCAVAAGEADVYPRFGRTMEWDTAAGQAILEAAGGVVVDGEGRPFRYGAVQDSFANGPFIVWGDPEAAVRYMSPHADPAPGHR
ncbi:3'(2'),5'-bisphosphate nucleotidase CysQ [Chelatococcus reniformis]|uniref:3'(2'),5'-bisphosphate nucleotidase CysQ n=2 Tax=Chelatococcus reniformis TaxID=1494448 RepID=A0A916XP05_9HYPH|nr:3'(2'),5'-bisphosphate nucleotidase CysQ [Chelatococcus reniformis]